MRSWGIAVLGLLAAACSSASDSDEVGPEPTDPLVYDASPETRAELGIVKWGYADNVGGGVAVFHAYGAKNEQLAEIKQSLSIVDDYTKRFSMTMTGAFGPANEEVDLAAVVSADFQTVSYEEHVGENTFTTGDAARVLAHLGPDSEAMANAAAAPGSTPLVQSIRPQDEPLVSNKPTELLQCCSTLNQQSASLGARAGSNCSLLQSTGSPLRSQSAGIDPEALVVGANGQPTVQSPWDGNYNIVDHHCHNAAAQNSSATDGYIACTSESSSTTTTGHTVSWAPDPRVQGAGAGGSFCTYEPQSNGGTLLTGRVCCWSGNKGANGAPTFDSPAARACVEQMCAGQAGFPGWTNLWLRSPPVAFPAGSKPPLPTDCPSSTNTLVSCNSCCTTQADTVAGLFDRWLASDRADTQRQVADYRSRCAVGCSGAETARNPQPQPQQRQPAQCTSSTLDWMRQRLGMQTTCGGGQNGGRDGGS